jgi:hypothetical protein
MPSTSVPFRTGGGQKKGCNKKLTFRQSLKGGGGGGVGVLQVDKEGGISD